MFIETIAYRAALTQLAAALAELDPALVLAMLKEEVGTVIMDDLFATINKQQPALTDALNTPNA